MDDMIEATYKAVTPIFCGGAEPVDPSATNPRDAEPDKGSVELRLASFKGVLRFWWRAVAWSHYSRNLKDIKDAENYLFGSAETGQSRILMHLRSSTEITRYRGKVLTYPGSKETVGEGARYLGYGMMEAFARRENEAKSLRATEDGQLFRPCLAPGLEFTVQLRLRGLRLKEAPVLREALIAVGVMGGMGGKSRKGYGSLALTRLTCGNEGIWRPPESVEDLSHLLKNYVVTNDDTGYPPYTAISCRSRHIVVTTEDPENNEPLRLLNLLGLELIRYRSWGRYGEITIRGKKEPAERNFERDHDLMKTRLKDRKKEHPRRIAFGLPHDYKDQSDQRVGPAAAGLDRRASPLFIHLHDFGHRAAAILSFIPARFLPDGASDISVGGKNIRQVVEDDLYKPVCDFLERLTTGRGRKEKIEAVEVTP